MHSVFKTKYYSIYHTDAFFWLSQRKESSIHSVVTDPPFSILEYLPEQIQKQRNGRGGIWRLPHNYNGHKRNPMPRFTVLTSTDYIRIKEFHRKLAPLLFKVLVPGAHVILSSQNLLSYLVINEFTGAGFEIRGQIARIVKTLRGGDRPKGAHHEYENISVTPRSCWEPWLIFRKPCEDLVRDNLRKWGTGALRRPETNMPFKDLIQSSPARKYERQISQHPSLKPQAFIRQIVLASLPMNKGILLDPFMGSGSTIAAATYFGIKSIGLEIDDEYFRAAKSSIKILSKIDVN